MLTQKLDGRYCTSKRHGLKWLKLTYKLYYHKNKVQFLQKMIVKGTKENAIQQKI